MEIHIVTEDFCLLEYEDGDGPTPEALQGIILQELIVKGIKPWPSIELEELTYNNKSLIFAHPVRVYMPSWLLNYPQ